MNVLDALHAFYLYVWWAPFFVLLATVGVLWLWARRDEKPPD